MKKNSSAVLQSPHANPFQIVLPLQKSFESIHMHLGGSGISGENYLDTIAPVLKDIEHVQQVYQLSKEEAWLFAVILIQYLHDGAVSTRELAEYLRCTSLFVQQCQPYLDYLLSRELLRPNERRRLFIRRNTGNAQVTSFEVPYSIIRHVVNGEEFPDPYTATDDYQLMEMMVEAADQCAERELPLEELRDLHRKMLQANEELPVLHRLGRLQLDTDEKVLLLCVCYNTLNNREVDVNQYAFVCTDSYMDRSVLKRQLLDGSHRLMQEQYIELEDGFFISGNNLRLTLKGTDLMTDGATTSVQRREPTYKLLTRLKADDISEVALMYPEQIQRSRDELTTLLTGTHLQDVCSRLKAQGLSTAFSVLLYGPSGTGKTEMVRQLARETQRNVLMVNMADIKDKWVGGSEKNIKQVFQEYQKAKDFYTETPILLLNEADALLGKRSMKKGEDSPVGQMLNTMQNILLQEMEDFDGILIATTNQQLSLDQAFDRRFLYKLEVSRPDREARRLIWESRFAQLTPTEVRQLADLDVTGAHISNIVRKAQVAYTLHGEDIDFTLLYRLALEEGQYGKPAHTIGFHRHGTQNRVCV